MTAVKHGFSIVLLPPVFPVYSVTMEAQKAPSLKQGMNGRSLFGEGR